MGQSLSSEQQWIACPRCHIANLATSVYCNSCGAALDPGEPPPRYPSGASPKQWALIVGISSFLIGTALWAAFSPNGIAGKIFGAFVPTVYCAGLFYGIARSVRCFRRRDFSGGILQSALTVLFALAALPAVLDFDR